MANGHKSRRRKKRRRNWAGPGLGPHTHARTADMCVLFGRLFSLFPSTAIGQRKNVTKSDLELSNFFLKNQLVCLFCCFWPQGQQHILLSLFYLFIFRPCVQETKVGETREKGFSNFPLLFDGRLNCLTNINLYFNCVYISTGNGMVTQFVCRKCWAPTGQQELELPMDRIMPLLTQLKR